MKKTIALMILLVLLMTGCALAEEYTPSHTVFGLQFGCTPDEYIEVLASYGIEAGELKSINEEESYIKTNGLKYLNNDMALTAHFDKGGTSLLWVTLEPDSYSSKKMSKTEVLNRGFTRLRTFYDSLSEIGGEPTILLTVPEHEDESGERIYYSIPVVDGLPDLKPVIDIFANLKDSGCFLAFIWDNMFMYTNYGGWHLKNQAPTWIYSTSISFRRYDVNKDYEDKTILPFDAYGTYGQIVIQ